MHRGSLAVGSGWSEVRGAFDIRPCDRHRSGCTDQFSLDIRSAPLDRAPTAHVVAPLASRRLDARWAARVARSGFAYRGAPVASGRKLDHLRKVAARLRLPARPDPGW